MAILWASYQSQIRVENGVTYYTGSTYPDKNFFDAHWTYGQGSTLIIPSSLVWEQVTTKVPAMNNLGLVEKMLTTEAKSYPINSKKDLIWEMGVDYYRAFGYQVTESIPYSLGKSTLIATMSFTKVSDHVVQGTVTYQLKADEFDWERNNGEKSLFSFVGDLKRAGEWLAGPGTKYQIAFSGNTALQIEGTVADVGPASGINDGKYYPVENSTRTVIGNYQPPSTAQPGSGSENASINIVTPTDAATRNSNIYITDTSSNDHLVVIRDGGRIWDAYVVQKTQPNGFVNWTDFQAAVAVSNPNIPDLNQVAAGITIYMPERFTEGSITYHYAGGISINNNATTGEYHMVVPNTNGTGGQTIYSRTSDGNGLGDEGYTVKQITTNQAGATIFDFIGRQAGLTAEVKPVSVTEQLNDVETSSFYGSDGTLTGRSKTLISADGTPTSDSLANMLQNLRNATGDMDDLVLDAAELRTLSGSQIEGEAWGGARLLTLGDSALSDYYRHHQDIQTGATLPLMLDDQQIQGLGLLDAFDLSNGASVLDGSFESESWNYLNNSAGNASYIDWGYDSSVIDYPSYNYNYNYNYNYDYNTYSYNYDYSTYGAYSYNNYTYDIYNYTYDIYNYNAYNYDSYDYGWSSWWPVALDMDGDGIELVTQEDSHAWYDVQGDGYRRNIGWVGSDDAFLAIDENHDGKITDARELSFAMWTADAGDTDLQALQTAFDTNHDQKFDAQDARFADLRVWQDKNGDGVSDAGELKTLAEAGIKSINLGVAQTDWSGGGNHVAGFATYEKTNGTRGWAADVGLGYDTQGWKASVESNLVRMTESGGLVYGIARTSALNLDLGAQGLDGAIGGAARDLLAAGSKKAVLLEGGAGDDRLVGGAGDDWLAGDAGSDMLLGGDGDDTLVIDAQDAQGDLDGGAGFDMAVVTGNAAVSLDLGAAGIEAAVGGVRNDNLRTSGTGRVILAGGAGNDMLAGSAAGDLLYGGTGDDTLQGGRGNDVYVFNRGDGTDDISDAATTMVTTINTYVEYYPVVVLAGPVVGNPTYQRYLNQAQALLQSKGEPIGSAMYSSILTSFLWSGRNWQYSTASRTTGTSSTAEVEVDAGQDTLRFGADIGREDLVLTVNGADWMFSVAHNGVAISDRITLRKQTNSKARIEFVEFADGQKYAMEDLVFGTAGADALAGTAAANVISGGVGGDTMRGGAGNDFYVTDNAGDSIVENANEGTDTVLSSVSYSLGANVENMVLTGLAALNGTGNALNNTLTGNAGNNVLDGGLGDDTLDGSQGDDVMLGGAGNDTYGVDSAGDVVIETSSLAGEIDTVLASASYTLSANVENLTLTGSSSINATGNTLGNILTGNTANNLLDGGAGNDTLIGGLGNDLYVVNSALDVVTEKSNEGTDTVQAGVDYMLAVNVENLTLLGVTAVRGTGNTLNNVLTGNAAGNVLDGGTGEDTLQGAAGNDTYIVNSAGDAVRESINEGIDTVQSAVSHTLSANVEHLTLTARAALNGTGNALNNTLVGNSAANVLDGDAGNDTLIGGWGNDTLTGGAGDDVMDSYGPETRKLYVFNTGNGMVARSIVDDQTVMEMGMPGAWVPSGHVGQTLQILGSSIADKVYVTAGSSVDATGLGGGIDEVYLTGRRSDYTAAYAGNTITLTRQTGLPTGQAEVVKLHGGTAVQLDSVYFSDGFIQNYGLLNAIKAGTAAVLDTSRRTDASVPAPAVFSEGADSMAGGLGNDTFMVDDAGDLVQENAGEGTDTVESYLASYTLSANVENLTLLGGLNAGGAGNALNNTITGNGTNNTLIGGWGNDTLMGGSGDDVLDKAIPDPIKVVVLPGSVAKLVAGDQVIEGVAISAGWVPSGHVGQTLQILGSSTVDKVYVTAGSSVDATGLASGVDEIYLTGRLGDYAATYSGNTITLTRQTGLPAGQAEVVKLHGGTAVQLDNVYFSDGFIQNYALSNAIKAGTAAVLDTSRRTDASVPVPAMFSEGADTMAGGLGNDIFVVDDAGDVVTELAGEGMDTVQSYLASYTLSANVENLTLLGGLNAGGAGNALNNTITGNGTNNTLIGGWGNDTLSGGAGDDMMGGYGPETRKLYVINTGSGMVARSTVDEQMVMEMALSGGWVPSGHVGQSLQILGSSSVDKVYVTAGSSVDGTSLGGGIDEIYLTGRLGDYAAAYAGNTITLTRQTGLLAGQAEVVKLSAGSGALMDNLYFSDGYVKTNALLNSLKAGTAVVLDTNQGTDASIAVPAVFSEGADAMAGATGNDIFMVDDAGDVVIENANEGTDTVQSYLASYTLGAHVENLTLLGNLNASGTGNAQANVLAGNTGNNTLAGGAGGDTYQACRGMGQDRIVENDATSGNTDTLSFGTGIATNQLWFSHTGNDLAISIIGTADRMTVQNWYLGNQYHVEQIKTSDNKVLLDTQVEALVQAMAAFTPPAMGQTSLTAAQQTALAPVLAANWH